MRKSGKILIAAWLVLAVFVLIYKGIRPGWNDTATDFNNYYASAKLLNEGESIHAFYSNEQFNKMAQSVGVEQGAKFSPFPPPTAVLYWPLSFFDLLTAKRVWLVFNVLLLCWLPSRMRRYFGSSIWKNSLVLSLFVIPLSSNLHFGQFYFVTTFVLLEAVGYSFSSQKIIFPSVLMAALASVKYIPILFIGYLLKVSKGVFQPIIVSIVALLAITGLFMLIDVDAYPVYVSDLLGHVNGDLSGQGKFAVGFQSIDALLNNLFVFDPIENVKPLLDAPWLKSVLKWTVVGIVAVTCWWMFHREKYAFSPVTVSIGIVGAFVLVPASASYHFLLLIVPVFFILRWLNQERGIRHFMIATGLILGAFSVQAYQIPTINDWPVLNLLIHFPRLWFLLALFSFLVCCKRSPKNA